MFPVEVVLVILFWCLYRNVAAINRRNNVGKLALLRETLIFLPKPDRKPKPIPAQGNYPQGYLGQRASVTATIVTTSDRQRNLLPYWPRMTVIETLKYIVTPGETVSLCALKFELTEEDSSDLRSTIPASKFVTVFLQFRW